MIYLLFIAFYGETCETFLIRHDWIAGMLGESSFTTTGTLGVAKCPDSPAVRMAFCSRSKYEVVE